MDNLTITASQRRAVVAWHAKNDPNGDDFEFQDNHRYAVKGDLAQERAYESARDHGCCGFVDVELTCDDGSVLLYGFNYGH